MGKQPLQSFSADAEMDAQKSIPSEDESHRDAQRKPLWSEQADNVPDRASTPCQFVVIGGRQQGRRRGSSRELDSNRAADSQRYMRMERR